MDHQVRVVSVFASGPDGGNPAPIVVDAAGMTDADMQHVARSHGHESGFVFPAPAGSACDFEFRFWVPNHEMSMCGHATVGALWLMERMGRLAGDSFTVLTRSGRVEARIGARTPQGTHTPQGARIEISQPAGTVAPLPDADRSRADIAEVLGLHADDLAPLPVQNAATSRVKTLVPLKSVTMLDSLSPDFSRIEALCLRIGSTGLYPYAVSDEGAQVIDARQFPSSSGYPEDAATGIAASALAFGLLSNGIVEASERQITVRQGRAMQRPSEISVRFRLDDGRPAGCWLGGAVRMAQQDGVQP
jgi:PhzF family phenazine biosynthesis protein